MGYGKVSVMISNKMQAAFNNQINAEFYSSYLYLSMSAYFESLDLSGFANWMKVQFAEEQFHTMKMYDYLIERGGLVKLSAIEAPTVEFASCEEVFELTLAHEQKVTGLINNLFNLARDERDNASEQFLQWYVNEQVEEESNVSKILSQLKRFKDSPHALFMMDKDMAVRAFVAPTA